MVAVPDSTAVTTPLDIFATFISDDHHVTVLFVAFVGSAVASKVSVLPTVNVSVVLLKATDVTFTTVDVV